MWEREAKGGKEEERVGKERGRVGGENERGPCSFICVGQWCSQKQMELGPVPSPMATQQLYGHRQTSPFPCYETKRS